MLMMKEDGELKQHPLNFRKSMIESDRSREKGYMKLKNNSSTPDSLNSFRKYTLIYAISKGYFNMVRYLLLNGADPNNNCEQDKYKRTPLIYCTYIKDDGWALNVAQNLLEFGANLRKCDIKQLTAFHYCCAFGRSKLLELFLNSLDFDLLDSVDQHGNTCLHYAAKYGDLKCIRLILNKCKHYRIRHIQTTNVFGLTPTDVILLEEKSNNENKIKTAEQMVLYEKCRNVINNYLKLLDVESRFELSTENLNNQNINYKINHFSPNNENLLRPLTVPANLVNLNPDVDKKREHLRDINNQNVEIKTSKDTEQIIRNIKSSKEPLRKSYSIKNINSSSSNELNNSNKIEKIKQDAISSNNKNKANKVTVFLIERNDAYSIEYNSLCNTYLDPQVLTSNDNNRKKFINQSENQISLSRSASVTRHFTPSTTPLGRVSRQSYVLNNGITASSTGLVKESYTDLAHMNENSLNDIMYRADSYSYISPPKYDNIPNYNQSSLIGWKKYMMSLLLNMEIKESPSYRKTIHPPLNTRVITPSIDMHESSEKFRTNQRSLQTASSIRTLKQKAARSRQNSVISSASTFNSPSGNISTKTKTNK